MFRLGETVTNVHHLNDSRVVVDLESGKRLAPIRFCLALDVRGTPRGLNLEAAGLSRDDRGRIET